MTRLAITGHRGLPPATEDLIDRSLRAALGAHAGNDPVGVSCLADGADALFALAVLDLGGRLVAVVPARRYREGLPAAHHGAYDALLARASEVVRLDFEESTSQAHMAASEAMLGLADQLIAVWDGQPSRGFGGTADVVTAARTRGLAVVTVWPPGAVRD